MCWTLIVQSFNLKKGIRKELVTWWPTPYPELDHYPLIILLIFVSLSLLWMFLWVLMIVPGNSYRVPSCVCVCVGGVLRTVRKVCAVSFGRMPYRFSGRPAFAIHQPLLWLRLPDLATPSSSSQLLPVPGNKRPRLVHVGSSAHWLWLLVCLFVCIISVWQFWLLVSDFPFLPFYTLAFSLIASLVWSLGHCHFGLCVCCVCL